MPDIISMKKAIKYRQSIVAQALVKGFKISDIVLYLEQKGVINSKNNKPYTLSTVWSDIQALTKQWESQSFKAINMAKSRVWAEIQEVKKIGWSNNDMDIVLKAIKQERELMGLDEKSKTGIDLADLPQIIYVRSDKYNILNVEKKEKE